MYPLSLIVANKDFFKSIDKYTMQNVVVDSKLSMFMTKKDVATPAHAILCLRFVDLSVAHMPSHVSKDWLNFNGSITQFIRKADLKLFSVIASLLSSINFLFNLF